MQKLVAICLCKNFAFSSLSTFLCQQLNGSVYRGAVTAIYENKLVVVFDFGCVVTWGLTTEQNQAFFNELQSFMLEPLPEPVVDEFTYEHSHAVGAAPGLKDDHIRLVTDDDLEKLAFSFGLVQSVKLEEFERKADQTIDETYPIPKRIAETGVSGLSRKEIARLRGHLFVTQADINLKFDLLDTPEFFWEYPELEDRYRIGTNFLDVSHRIDVLNKRLVVIHGMLEMLADEHNHSHSATLEWIIIWLIAFEVVIFFVHDIFKVF